MNRTFLLKNFVALSFFHGGCFGAPKVFSMDPFLGGAQHQNLNGSDSVKRLKCDPEEIQEAIQKAINSSSYYEMTRLYNAVCRFF